MKNNRTQIAISIIESMVANLQKYEDLINELNVFPVPDGDTGSNMVGTLITGFNNITSNDDPIKVWDEFATGTLMGARGNSGVITSQIIRGFAEGLKQVGSFSSDTKNMRIILASSRDYAYKAVMTPVEGTILSIIRALDEKYDRETTDILEAAKASLKVAEEALAITPDQLPILKEAGVVDSGAKGLVFMIEGAIMALEGKPLTIKVKEGAKPEKIVKADANKNIGYCSEYVLTLKDPENFDEQAFTDFLKSIGDSTVVVKEGDVLKVHVHTLTPSKFIEEGHKHGQFTTLKIENMTTQVEENEAFSTLEDESAKVELDPSKLAIIAVSTGEGLTKLFKEAGVHFIVEGGQTMNPSVQDFKNIIDGIENKEILILPNNSNIILTAEQVKKNMPDRKVNVLPTKTLQQGVFAMYNINEEMIGFEDYSPAFIDQVTSLKQAEMTHAVRETKMNGIEIKPGQFISIVNKEIIASKDTQIETAKVMVDTIMSDSTEAITLIYNNEFSEQEREELKTYITSKAKIDIDEIYGGQEVYNLLMFTEDEE